MVYSTFGCRVLTCLVFVVAVAAKLRDFTEFEKSLRRLAPFTGPMTRPAAVAVLAAEILTILALLVPRTVAIGFAAALALDLAFTLALVVALRRGVAASCHCFGATGRPLGAHHVVRDVVLAAAAATGLAGALSSGGQGAPPGLLVAGAAGAAGAAVVVLLDDIVGLFASEPEEISWPISARR